MSIGQWAYTHKSLKKKDEEEVDCLRNIEMCLLLTVNIILSWPSSAVLCSLVRNIQTNLGPIVPWVGARNKTNNASSAPLQ